MATPQTVQNGNVTVNKFNEDEVKHVPLSDIYVDHNWNARSLANTMAEQSENGDKEGTGIVGLKDGIFADGQKDPIELRPTTDGSFYKKVAQPYALVAGFRRFEAIKALNADAHLTKLRADEGKTVVPNTANGSIRAVITSMSEMEARKRNIAENTQRDDLSPPDLCLAVTKLGRDHKMTANAIATTIGKSLNYVYVLQRVGSLKSEILVHWRNGGEFAGIKTNVRVKIQDLDDLSKVEADKQIDEYKKLLQSKTPGDKKDDTMWLKAAKSKAEKFGTLLGMLSRKDYGPTEDQPFVKLTDKVSFVDVIEVAVKVGKKELPRRIVRKLADEAEKAYNAALTAEPEEEEEEEDE